MGCNSPIVAFQTDDGEVVFAERGSIRRELSLPCGKCMGCRLSQSDQWASRIAHEASMHSSNWFLTLTYDPEHLPADGSLDHRHFQLFAKRLRKKAGSFRFFMCGEYGDRFGRPHYHALLFGLSLPDRVCIAQRSGFNVYTSAVLADAWSMGSHEVGPFTAKSAAYVAGYVTKKLGDSKALERVDPETGEIHTLKPMYGRMSLRPAIGATWVSSFGTEVFNNDAVIREGRTRSIPRYYRTKLKASHKEHYEQLEKRDYDRAIASSSNQTQARRAAREAIQRAKLAGPKGNL